MIVGAIDNATNAGWAIVDTEREQLLGYGHRNVHEPLAVNHLAGEIALRYRPGLVAIEDNFLGSGPKMNVDTVKALSRLVGRWELALAERGIAYEIMMPEVWQRGVLAGLVQWRPHPKRAQLKEAAKKFARLAHRVTCTEDEADAIGLATHIARRVRFQMKVQQQLW